MTRLTKHEIFVQNKWKNLQGTGKCIIKFQTYLNPMKLNQYTSKPAV